MILRLLQILIQDKHTRQNNSVDERVVFKFVWVGIMVYDIDNKLNGVDVNKIKEDYNNFVKKK